MVHQRIALILCVLCASAVNCLAGAPSTLPSETIRIPNSTVSFTMLHIPKGTSNGFWLGRTEVTWAEYEIYYLRLDLPEKDRLEGVDIKVHPSLPYGLADHGLGRDNRPAIGLHSNAAISYCKWLSKKTGKTYRLPTEQEWEYACRAGATQEPFTADALKDHAWFAQNTENENGDPVPQEIGKRKPNAWGFCDMLGNIAEWTIAEDGTPVVKGGSYRDQDQKINSHFRQPLLPSWQASDPEWPKSRWWLRDAPHVGFRLLREE